LIEEIDMNHLIKLAIQAKANNVAYNIVEGYTGEEEWYREGSVVFLKGPNLVSVVSTGFQTTVETSPEAASLAINLIALNQLLWDAYNTGNETICEFWTEMYHDLRNKILEEKNTFSLTGDEISSILTIID
jgi:hypothetical protein